MKWLKNNLLKKLSTIIIVILFIIVSPGISAMSKVETVEIHKWIKIYDAASCYDKKYGDGEIYKITWKKIKGANGYQVNLYEKENANDSWYKMVYKQKKCSASLGFSSCYAIKAKVRAYKVKNGKKIFGPWSKTIKKVVGV